MRLRLLIFVNIPSEIIKKILQYSSKKGDLVLVPFLGSGQVAVVCKEMGRPYLGFEMVKEYFEFAESRLKNTIEQKLLVD